MSGVTPSPPPQPPPSPERVQEAVDHLAAHGWYIWERALDDALCDDVLAEIDRLEHGGVPRSLDNDFHGHRTIRFYDVLNQGDVWQRLPVHPAILPVVRAVLGEDCLLNTYGTSIICPGEPAQRIHVDDGPFIAARHSVLRGRPHLGPGQWRQPIVCNTMIALCDFTERNGATRFVDASHTLPYPARHDVAAAYEARTGRPMEPRAAVMPKGSVLFFEGSCYHGGGANEDDTRRYAVTVDYCAGYLRAQENFLFSLDRQRLAGFDEELQALVGLRMSEAGLGHVYTHAPDPLQARIAMASTPLFVG
ncbi:MAG: phytanoyl-CoA dioxygenase family protein [Acidimicrobiia bacterium]